MSSLGLRARLAHNVFDSDGLSVTRRGFTDHEHLDEVEIIHMNGRVYDYNLGRFMSVDPIIHGGSQGLNPYSYIMNNPLSGTDPSGYAPEQETVDLQEGDVIVQDADGNRYVDKGGDTLTKIESVTVTAKNGASVTANYGDGGGITSGSVTTGKGTYAVSDIGGQNQIATFTPSPTATGGESSGGERVDSGPTATIDWEAYINDENARSPIDSSMLEMFNMSAEDSPWNFSIEFENWIAANQHINSSQLEKLAQTFALLNRFGRSSNGRNGVGLYKHVGGHHIHAKAAFKNHANYNLRNGLSISNAMMKGLGLDHAAMTAFQRRAFKELYESGAANSLKAHTKIAVGALQAGGASREWSRTLAAQSLLNLRAQGVRMPTNIPWYK